MAQKVLVPVDDSEQAKKAFDYALESYGEAAITLLHVIKIPDSAHPLGKSGSGGTSQIKDEVEDSAKQLLAELKSKAASRDVDVDTDTTYGSITKEIVNYADAKDFDLIVIGSHGRTGASRVLLGSVAESVARRATIPVLIQR